MSTAFESLFGPQLTNKDQTSPTVQAIGNAEVIGVYFSAHWCPPCRGFTPRLVTWYNHLRSKGIKIEIVFVSSDKDEKSFSEYYHEMPWLALPFVSRDLKTKVSSKYKVQGIPTFVLLDKEGRTITTEGRDIVMEDAEGTGFPWTPAPFSESIGSSFERPNHEKISSADLKGKVVGLYFSAHWCPPCKAFTPKLAETYKKIQANFPGKFEILFVSSDKDEHQFHEYHHEMPWPAVPYSDRERKNKLSKLFKVNGIPTLVIVDFDSGVVINPDGRSALSNDSEGLKFPWHPPAVKDLSEPDGIQESKSVIVLAGAADKATQDSIEKELTPVSTRYLEEAKATGEDAEYLFFLGREKEGVAERIQSLTKVDAGAGVKLVLLDIPDEGGFYVDDSNDPITSASVEQFLAKVKSGAIKRSQLSN